MISGECNCGQVGFEIAGDLSDIIVCHCSICRKYTGANGIAVTLANTDDFRWTKGEDKVATWKKPDADWQAWFCQTCGSSLPGNNDERQMFIPAGLIRSGADELKVIHHIWVDSKAGWDEIGDAGKQHTEGFSG